MTPGLLRDARPELAKDPCQPALFVSTFGRRLSKSGLVLLIQHHARAAALRRASPHGLRHACATHLLRGGADVRQVQELLGPARLNTTARYTRVGVADLRAVLARCHPRELVRHRKGVD
jgi:site-specific recombinase XerD